MNTLQKILSSHDPMDDYVDPDYDSAYRNGYTDFQQGYPLEGNPYAGDELRWKEWDMGWIDAKYDSEDNHGL